jgi:diacylglycerol kinase (ATP)
MSAPPEPRSFWKGRLHSFRYAWRGIVALVRTQPNARIHLAASVAVLAAGFVLGISGGEWGLLALAMGLVWSAEAMNTAIEVLADRVTTEQDERIGRAKDLAAGAVLLASVAAAVIGGIVFLPRVLLFVGK